MRIKVVAALITLKLVLDWMMALLDLNGISTLMTLTFFFWYFFQIEAIFVLKLSTSTIKFFMCLILFSVFVLLN